MKLNKDTRDLVKIGTILKDSNGKQYLVTSMYESGRHGKNITVRYPDGMQLYGDRLSNWYGLEIIND